MQSLELMQITQNYTGNSLNTLLNPIEILEKNTPTKDKRYAFTDLEKASCMDEYFAFVSSVGVTNIDLPVFS